MPKDIQLVQLQNFQSLLSLHLSLGEAVVNRIVQGKASKAEIQALYVQLLSLSLSAQAHGLSSLEKICSSLCQKLSKFHYRDVSPSQSEPFKQLYQKLLAFLEIDLTASFASKDAIPRVCFYGLKPKEIARLLKKLAHQQFQYHVLDSLIDLTELTATDILIFKLTKAEQSAEVNDLLLRCKFLPMSQVFYLSNLEDSHLRLQLGAIGVENFFICQEDDAYLSRFFSELFTRFSSEVQPYKLCVVGNKPTLLALNKLAQLYGVETLTFTSDELALKAFSQNRFDGFLIDHLETAFDSSALVHAVRQFSHYKSTPIFYLDRAEGEIGYLNTGHSFDASIFLSRSFR